MKKLIDQSELDRKYDRGKRFVIMHDGKPVSYSKNPFTASQMADRFRNRGSNIEELKIVPIRDLMDRVPTELKDQSFLDEVQRIVKLVNPITEDEMEEVKKVAVQNIMKKDLEDMVCRMTENR